MSVGYIAVIVCLVLTTAGRKDVIYDIGKTHCPCTRFCSDDIKTVNTNGTEELIKTRSSPDDDNFDVCTTTDIYQPKETGINFYNQSLYNKERFREFCFCCLRDFNELSNTLAEK